MYIHEAIKKALRTGGVIKRENCTFGEEVRIAVIEPTNHYDCCNLVIHHNGAEQRTNRMWQPTADDLMTDNWVVINTTD